MKVYHKGLTIEVEEKELGIVDRIFEKLIYPVTNEVVPPVEKVIPPKVPSISSVTTPPPADGYVTTDEVIKLQERLGKIIKQQDAEIASYKNKIKQISYNADEYRSLKEGRDANIEKLENELKKLKTTSKDLKAATANKNLEIAALEAKIRELEANANSYSTAMADALKKNSLITKEEHDKAIENITMGRDVNTYWDNFTTDVVNYVPSPILVTDFGTYSVINCTPHVVVLSSKNGLITIGPSDVCTRLEMDQKDVVLEGSDLPLVVESKGKLINAPLRRPRTLYIVSRIVFDVSIDREDFICPNTIRATKSDGRVTSVPSFICRKELIVKDLGGHADDEIVEVVDGTEVNE